MAPLFRNNGQMKGPPWHYRIHCSKVIGHGATFIAIFDIYWQAAIVSVWEPHHWSWPHADFKRDQLLQTAASDDSQVPPFCSVNSRSNSFCPSMPAGDNRHPRKPGRHQGTSINFVPPLLFYRKKSYLTSAFHTSHLFLKRCGHVAHCSRQKPGDSGISQ